MINLGRYMKLPLLMVLIISDAVKGIGVHEHGIELGSQEKNVVLVVA